MSKPAVPLAAYQGKLWVRWICYSRRPRKEKAVDVVSNNPPYFQGETVPAGRHIIIDDRCSTMSRWVRTVEVRCVQRRVRKFTMRLFAQGCCLFRISSRSR